MAAQMRLGSDVVMISVTRATERTYLYGAYGHLGISVTRATERDLNPS